MYVTEPKILKLNPEYKSYLMLKLNTDTQIIT